MARDHPTQPLQRVQARGEIGRRVAPGCGVLQGKKPMKFGDAGPADRQAACVIVSHA
jgi:hypothetical protein